MSGLLQPDLMLCIENGFSSIHIHGKGCSGKNEIQLYHDLQVIPDLICIGSSLVA